MPLVFMLKLYNSLKKRVDMSSFKPAIGITNKHLQTVYATLFRKDIKLSYEIEIFPLQDGDFLECYWHKSNKQDRETPLVILFHGLAGSYQSPYIQGVMQALERAGFDSVLMHFRGCSGHDNKLPRSYHSGDSNDALEFAHALKKRFQNRKLYTVGYSLGANMLLKLLGEEGKNSPFDKAVAISAPMQLNICADAMNRGFSRYYQYRLIKDLNSALDKKYDKHPMQELIHLKREDVNRLKTFWEFDDAYTAPIHGFISAEEYYAKSSSRQFLKYITTPTLIIHSQDDPFMTPDVIPSKNELSSSITMELTQKGGHVGFVSGTLFQPEYWLERRIIEFFTN